MRGLTPLVGRRAEIEVFSKLVEQAASGKGQILAMVGEPGIGKSRLVHEFIRHQLRPGWLVLEGASVSYGKATPYFPLDRDVAPILSNRRWGRKREHPRASRDAILELDNMLKDAIPPILSLLGALPDENITPASDEHNWLSTLQDIADMIRTISSAMDPQQRRRLHFRRSKASAHP